MDVKPIDSGTPAPIVSPDTPTDRLCIRVRGAAIAAVCVGMLAAGAWLRPDPLGFGTHKELGLPACGMMVTTGYPCPTCGLTTSVSATMHGQILLAAYAQPFGLALVLAAIAWGTAGLAELVTGRSYVQRLRPGWWWLIGGAVGLLAGWGITLLIGVQIGRFPY